MSGRETKGVCCFRRERYSFQDDWKSSKSGFKHESALSFYSGDFSLTPLVRTGRKTRAILTGPLLPNPPISPCRACSPVRGTTY